MVAILPMAKGTSISVLCAPPNMPSESFLVMRVLFRRRFLGVRLFKGNCKTRVNNKNFGGRVTGFALQVPFGEGV